MSNNRLKIMKKHRVVLGSTVLGAEVSFGHELLIFFVFKVLKSNDRFQNAFFVCDTRRLLQ